MERAVRKTLEGIVMSNKMNKTVIVKVEAVVRHPIYKKVVRMFKKYKAHDEKNSCKAGDAVRIMETRPISKEKKWRVCEILKGEGVR